MYPPTAAAVITTVPVTVAPMAAANVSRDTVPGGVPWLDSEPVGELAAVAVVEVGKGDEVTAVLPTEMVWVMVDVR